MNRDALDSVAAAMVVPGKGILAIDESVPTISKRFAALGIESTEETRRQYRELLLSAPGIDTGVTGVILYDETFRQCTADGTQFPQLLARRGILPGIKVDTGAKPLPGNPRETITEGLDGLSDRIAEYRSLGAQFAKWRAVIRIGDGIPTQACIISNAHSLARYAAVCQEGGVVPIVEPEVLMEGDHSLARCDRVTRAVLAEVFAQLRLAGVDLRGVVLKPSMVAPGAEGPRVSVDEVAGATLDALADTVPSSVPGIAFLSGGQGSGMASAHLNAMAGSGRLPWNLTFSYGRALQDDALRTWGGAPTNVAAAQAALLQRVRCNAEATLGRYDAAMEAV